LDYYKDKALPYTSFFLARRFIFAFVIVFCGSSLVLQVFLADLLSTLLLVFFISVGPMNDKFNNFIQVVNELTVLTCVWLMFHYSEFVASPETRYDLGFYFMYLVAVDVILNMLFLLYIVVKRIYMACKSIFIKAKARQNIKTKVQESQLANKKRKIRTF